VNPETIDNEYQKLEQEVEGTSQAIDAMAQKLKAAADAGDANAREWLLDLKSIALSLQQDHLQMQSLMQAMHDFVVEHLSDQPSAAYGGQPGQPAYQQPAYQQPAYAPQPSYSVCPPGAGGTLSRFMSGAFGRAIMTGAGFGIGDDLINRIF